VVVCDKLYVGGAFSQIGPRTGPVVVLSRRTGRRDTRFPDLSGGRSPSSEGFLPEGARALVGDGREGFFAAGGLGSRSGTSCGGLLHVRRSGRIDTRFCARANGPIRALARFGNTLFVGGDFTSIGGRRVRSLAALDAVTGRARAWDPRIRTVRVCDRSECVREASVHALLIRGDVLYVAGRFSGASGSTRSNAFAVDARTHRLLAWQPEANGPVNALAVADRIVYLGGEFTAVAGRSRNTVAAVDAASGTPTPWNPHIRGSTTGAVPAPLSALLIRRKLIYVGGTFTSVGGARRFGLAAIDRSTGLATPWNPDLRGEHWVDVHALQAERRTLYVGGEFKEVRGVPRNGAAAVDLRSGRLAAWDPHPNGPVDALMLNRFGVVAAGQFSGVGATSRRNLAEIDLKNGAVTSWDPLPTDAAVGALLARDGLLYVGGSFRRVAGEPRASLAAFLLPSMDLFAEWAPTIEEGGDGVEALAANGSVVYVGGDFETVNGEERTAAAAIDAQTGELAGWNPQIGHRPGESSSVSGIAVVDRLVYLAGYLSRVSDRSRQALAAVTTDSGARLAWSVAIDDDGSASTVAVAGRRVYFGGSFTSINDQPRTAIAELDTDGTLGSWNPKLQQGQAGNSVEDIVATPRVVFIAGDFRAVNGTFRPGVAALDVTSGAVMRWLPPSVDWAAYEPDQLLLNGRTLYVNGNVTGNGEQLVGLDVNSLLKPG
jgi:hypothetical protein